MKRLFAAAALIAMLIVSAHAQVPTYATFLATAVGGSPMIVVPQKQGGVINVGQAFGEIAEPYINAAVNSLIMAGLTWLFWLLRTKLNINIDAEHRASITAAAQRQAASLIADGKVALQGKTITVDNEALAEAANAALVAAPDAAARFGLTPESVAKRIVDFIPQSTAGAAIIAASPTAKAGS